MSAPDPRERTIGRSPHELSASLTSSPSGSDTLFTPSRLIIRHALVSLSFVLLYLLLNRPEVVFFSRIGFVAWYPAIGLVMALLLGVSPWYGVLVCLADALAGKTIYAQSAMSF